MGKFFTLLAAVFFTALIFFSGTLKAAEPQLPLLNLKLEDPDAPSVGAALEDFSGDKAKMIAIYQKYCTRSAVSKTLAPLMGFQCACTADKISKIMDVKQVRSMYEDTAQGNFDYARMITLAYIPCMAEAVQRHVFKICNENQKTKNYFSLCKCHAQRVKKHVLEKGQGYVPGFGYHSGFDKSITVANPLEHMMSNKYFQKKSSHMLYLCRLDQMP